MLIFDVSFWAASTAAQRPNGLTRVERELAGELARQLNSQLQLVHSTLGGFEEFHPLVPGAKRPLGAKVALGPDDILLFSAHAVCFLDFEQLEYARSAGAKVACIVYDMTPFFRPELCGYTPDAIRVYDKIFKNIDLVLCISDAAVDDVTSYCNLRRLITPEIRKIRLGADLPQSRMGGAVMPRRPYALAVGTFEIRKNFKFLIDIWHELSLGNESFALDLVIVGAKGWMAEAVIERLLVSPLFGSRIFWLEDASDEVLGELYLGASVLLYPSLFEGWGLPIVEALAVGTPVIGSERGAVPEAGLGLSTTIALGDREQWKAAILECSVRRPQRVDASGLIPTWQGTAEAVLVALTARFDRQLRAPRHPVLSKHVAVTTSTSSQVAVTDKGFGAWLALKRRVRSVVHALGYEIHKKGQRRYVSAAKVSPERHAPLSLRFVKRTILRLVHAFGYEVHKKGAAQLAQVAPDTEPGPTEKPFDLALAVALGKDVPHRSKQLTPRVEVIHDLLRPMITEGGLSFTRVGSAGDGGYVMVDEGLEQGGVAYSFGISNDVTWDRDMAERGFEVFMFDHTITSLPEEHSNFHWSAIGISGVPVFDLPLATLEALVSSNSHSGERNMILKMDVEGAEWEVFRKIKLDVLGQFSQIAVELHGLGDVADQPKNEQMVEALTRIGQLFVPVHFHANNFADIVVIGGRPISPVVEVTFLRRDGRLFEVSGATLPSGLDAPNCPEWADHVPYSWDLTAMMHGDPCESLPDSEVARSASRP